MFDAVKAIEDYVRFPSVSTDSSCKEGMAGARKFIGQMLQRMGFEVEYIETPLHPLVLAEREGKPDWPHIVIYGHYDVQPADPIEAWDTPPFEPEIRNGRLYGRGAADNKGPLMVHVAAIARLLEKQPNLPLRITFLIEGEEEIGSPSFAGFLEQYKERLKGDFVLLSDTMSPSTDQIAITTGLRGIVCVEAELTGPRTDLHSGIHGGVLLNPIQAAARICASLHTPEGRVNIDGFYNNVREIEQWERDELKKLGKSEQDYAGFLGISAFYIPGGLSPFEATRFAPTLEFNGIGGGFAGEGVKTVIPSKAFVKISCRLVPDMDPVKTRQLLAEAIKQRCPKEVKLRIHTGHCGAPYLVIPPDRPNTPASQPAILAKAFRAAERSITETFGKPPLYLREGGSVPIIADLKRVVGLDSLMIGMFTVEDNLHAPNESFHLGMFEKGVEASKELLCELAGT